MKLIKTLSIHILQLLINFGRHLTHTNRYSMYHALWIRAIQPPSKFYSATTQQVLFSNHAASALHQPPSKYYSATTQQVLFSNHAASTIQQPPSKWFSATTKQVLFSNHPASAIVQPPSKCYSATTQQVLVSINVAWQDLSNFISSLLDKLASK